MRNGKEDTLTILAVHSLRLPRGRSCHVALPELRRLLVTSIRVIAMSVANTNGTGRRTACSKHCEKSSSRDADMTIKGHEHRAGCTFGATMASNTA